MNNLLLPKDLFDRIKNSLVSGLDHKLTYHNWGHTERVLEYSEKFAVLCSKSPEERRLLQTAALLHDYGYLERYDQNDVLAARYAEKILPEYGYSKNDIEIISRMIISTVPGTYPEPELDQILCDADICPVGFDAFYESGETYRNELRLVKGLVYIEREWIELELKFLLAYKFNHKEVEKLLQAGKEKNIRTMQRFLDTEKFINP